VKHLAPLVGKFLVEEGRHPAFKMVGLAVQRLPGIVDQISPPVAVRDMETCIYLDDSPSMTEGGALEEGHAVLRAATSPLLRDRGSCRVVKFGGSPTVLVPGDDDALSGAAGAMMVQLAWDGSSWGTYMWHMIEQDVMARYQPGGGKLRLMVITDGEDTCSPAGYNGVQGMDPMMRALTLAGFDIEWHIVVIGRVPGSRRYADLAAATGGSFLAVEDLFDEGSEDARRFLDTVERSGELGADATRRRWRREEYQVEAREGRREKFDWLKALPPPSS